MDNVSNEASTLLNDSKIDAAKEGLTHAAGAVQDKLQKFVAMAKEGNTSIRGLALISGLALVVSSCYELVTNAICLHLTATLVAFYSLVMGSVAVAMEVDPKALPYGEQIRSWLIKYIGLVQLSTGRGVFYLVAGSLELTQVRDVLLLLFSFILSFCNINGC
jgi:hypothetical protein